MKYDNLSSTRRMLLRGAVCLGLLGIYRTVTAAPAHTPSPGGAERLDGTRPAMASTYRLRPLAGTAPMSQTGPLRRPVAVRRQAQLTLGEPGKKIALTFDDGPHPGQTPAVLKILRQYDTRATFFVIGQNADWNSDLVRAIADDGHVVANHSWSHPMLPRLSDSRVRKELGSTCDLIERALGVPPRLARAPYGAWHEPSLKICAELGIVPMGWSVDTLDWNTPGTTVIQQRVLTGAHPGAIVLAHDGGGDRSQTVAALAHCLPRLIDQGYTMVQLA